MTDDLYERLLQGSPDNGTGPAGDADLVEDADWRAAVASDIGAPEVAQSPDASSLILQRPELRQLADGRRGRRQAMEQQRQLDEMAFQATKTGFAIAAVVSVNTFAVGKIDEAQERMINRYVERRRPRNMNGHMQEVVRRMIHLTTAQIMAYAEDHGKRQRGGN
jgi:hypothetical protein